MTKGIFLLAAVGGIILTFFLVAGGGVVSDIQIGICVGMIGCVLISMVGYKVCDVQDKFDATSRLLAKQSERVVAKIQETGVEPAEQLWGLYIKSELLSRLSKKETIVLFQMLRIVRSLHFWMRLHAVIPEEENPVFRENNCLELLFTLIGIYKESARVFDRHVNELLSMELSDEMKVRLSEYSKWLSTYNEDEYLKVVTKVRNSVSFHFDEKIYKEYVNEGITTQDLLFGIARSERWMDVLYTEPSSVVLDFIADVIPDVEGQDKIGWLRNKTIEESHRFRNFLNEVIREILKGNAYKKPIEI